MRLHSSPSYARHILATSPLHLMPLAPRVTLYVTLLYRDETQRSRTVVMAQNMREMKEDSVTNCCLPVCLPPACLSCRWFDALFFRAAIATTNASDEQHAMPPQMHMLSHATYFAATCVTATKTSSKICHRQRRSAQCNRRARYRDTSARAQRPRRESVYVFSAGVPTKERRNDMRPPPASKT